MNISKLSSTLALAFLVALAIACGGGSSSSSSSESSTQTVLRLAGGKEGDVVNAYDLSGNMITYAAVSSDGSASINVDNTDYSVHLKYLVDGVELFETLITKDELVSAASESSVLNVTLNSATTVLTQSIESDELIAIYNKEDADTVVITSEDTTSDSDSSESSSSDAEALTKISALTNSDITLTLSESNGTFNGASTKRFTFSSSGTLFVDNVSVSSTAQSTSSGIYWSSSDYNYNIYITDNAVTSVLVADPANAINSGTYYDASSESNLAKASRSKVSELSLSQYLNSVFTLSSIRALTLTIAESTSSISSFLPDIRLQSVLSALALRTADEGELTSEGWSAIVSAAEGVASATADDDLISLSETLSDAVNEHLVVVSPVELDDFSSELSQLLGADGEDATAVASLLTSIQSGEATSALALVSFVNTAISVDSLTSKAIAAREANDHLTAFHYSNIIASRSDATDANKVFSAIDFLVAMPIKDAEPIDTFRKLAQLDYQYSDTAALEATLDDSDAQLDATVYGKPYQMSELPSLPEIMTYVSEGFLADIETIIGRLESVSTSFTSITIPVNQQGKDSDGEYLASSPVVIDSIDLEAIKTGLYLLKFKAEWFLGQNLEVAGINDNGTNTKTALFNAEMSDNTVALTGEAMLEGNWQPTNSLASDNTFDILNSGTISIGSGFPGKFVFKDIKDLDDIKVTAEIKAFDSDRINDFYSEEYGISSDFSVTTSSIDFDEINYFAKAYFFSDKNIELDDSLSTVVSYKYEITFAIEDITTGSNWIALGKAYREIDMGYMTYVDYATSYSYLSTFTVGASSTLAIDTSAAEYEETDLQSWVDDNTSFFTLTETYMTAARTSLTTAVSTLNGMIDEIQGNDDTTARINNVVEELDFLEFDNLEAMSDTEVNQTQSFVTALVTSFSEATSIDPSVFGTNLTTDTLDLTNFFEKDYRDYITNSSNEALFVAEELELDQTESDTTFDATIGADSELFGLSGETFGSTAKLYSTMGDVIDYWLDAGATDVNVSTFNDDESDDSQTSSSDSDIVTIGGVEFNKTTSDDLSAHWLELPNSAEYTFSTPSNFGSGGDTDDLTISTGLDVDGVPVVQLGWTDLGSGAFDEVSYFAIATNGGLYEIIDGSVQLIFSGVQSDYSTFTSPTGYTDSYAIITPEDDNVNYWTSYFKIGEWIIEEGTTDTSGTPTSDLADEWLIRDNYTESTDATVPTTVSTKSLDGFSDDWTTSELLFSDLVTLSTSSTAIDVRDVYLSQDDSNIYVLISYVGGTLPTDEYTNRWIYFETSEGVGKGVEIYHDTSSFRVELKTYTDGGNSTTLVANASVSTNDNIMELSIPKSGLDFSGSHRFYIFTHETITDESNNRVWQDGYNSPADTEDDIYVTF